MAADDSSPSCEFAWVAEESFDFVTLLTSLTAVKDAVGLKGFRGMTLAGRRDGPGMVLSFKFSTRSYSAALRKVIEREAAKLRCQPFDLLLISRSDREKLKERLAELPVTVEASGPSSEVVETFRERMGLKPSGPQTPRIRLTFDSPEALSAVYARQVAEGSVFIPSSKPPPPGQRLKLELAAQGVAEIETDAEALEPATQEGVSGFRAKLTLSEALRELVARHALQKREGRLAKGDAGQRQHPRFETFLEVAFADIPELSAEYATNISLGGLFVKAANPPPLRTRLSLRLRLPGGEAVETEAEVVHVVSPEEARARGTASGAGLSFATGRAEFDEKIEALLEHYGRRRPLVLIADEDATFSAGLAAALIEAGMEVEAAADGESALRKIVDRFFELDLLVLDLKMSKLDSAQLLHRIRRLGGELDLPVMLLSHGPREELARLAGPHGANEVLPKTTPLTQVLSRVRALVRSPPRSG